MNAFQVLIVDDEESVRSCLKKVIEWEKHGFQIVAEAVNGYEALKHIKSHSFDLIITDIRMPILDGIEFIDKIREISDSEIVVLSGYAEFEYAKKVMEHGIKHYLLKPIDETELIEVLENIRYKIIKYKDMQVISEQQNNIIKEKAIEQVLFGSNDDYYSLKELYNILNIRTQGVAYCVGIIKILTDLEEAMQIRDEMLSLLSEFINKDKKKFENIHFYQKHEYLYCFCCFDHRFEYDVKKTFEDLYYKFSSHFCVDSCFGIGNIVFDIGMAKESMRKALSAVDYAFFEGINKIIFTSDIMDRINLCQPVLKWDDTDLINSIKKVDKLTMDFQIDLLFNNLKNQFSSPRMVQTILLNLVFKVNDILVKYNTSINDINTEKIDIQEQLFSKKTIDDLKGWFKEFCHIVIEYIRKLLAIKNPDIVLDIKEYVEQSYAEDIYLKDIAQDMYYTPDYIGKLFKDSVGVSFTEYVNKKRMERAKELLMATDKKVSHISNLVGIRNTDYFTKQFKRYEGMTPKEFRNQYILGGK